MEIPLLVWVGINGALVFVAAVLTACFEVKFLNTYDKIWKKYKAFGFLCRMIMDNCFTNNEIYEMLPKSQEFDNF
jgi:hypothetical protein